MPSKWLPNPFGAFSRRQSPSDNASTTPTPDPPPEETQLSGSQPGQNAAFTRDEMERAIADPLYLAARFGVEADDPRIPILQQQMRADLAQDDQPTSDSAEDILLTWLNTGAYREQRRYLEAHPQLLDQAGDNLLHRLEQQYQERARLLREMLHPQFEQAMAQHEPVSDDLWQQLLAYGKAMKTVDNLRAQRLLLKDIRARRGANPDATYAIREGYINVYGGWNLDLPPWLAEVTRQLYELGNAGPGDETATARVALLRPAFAHAARRIGEVGPVIVAELATRLYYALNDSVSSSANPAGAQDEAITLLEMAQAIYSAERYPQQFAPIQNNLGVLYANRIAGARSENQERAIACYEAALSVYTAERFPQQFAETQTNLCNVYNDRVAGARSENQERAIACYEAALSVYTAEQFPQDYAVTQVNLGAMYANRVVGAKSENQERAIACYEAALPILTAGRFPMEYHLVQQNRAAALMQVRQWALAHEAWQGALAVEEELLEHVGDVADRDDLLKDRGGEATNDGYALLRLGRVEEAALTVERGRARGLAETRRIQSPNLLDIPEEYRMRYIEARNALASAQKTLISNSPITPGDLVAIGLDPAALDALDALEPAAREAAMERATRAVNIQRNARFNQAKAEFDAVVTAIRAERDSDGFLRPQNDLVMLQRAAARGGPGHALIYLGATSLGGMALGIFNGAASPGNQSANPRVEALDLPQLTNARLSDLVQQRLTSGDQRLIGGYIYAQEGNGFEALLQDWPGATLRARAHSLHIACQEAGVSGALDVAASRTIATLSAAGRANQTEVSLEELSDSDRSLIAGTFNARFLRLELRRCLAALADIALRPLAEWLRERGATSITLIPCGVLAAFPLAAPEIAPGVTFSDRFPTSIAPSARSLIPTEEMHRWIMQRKRAGVAALGDPRPTHQPLAWGEAEALTLAKLARQFGVSGESRVGAKARRDWLLKNLGQALVVDASCHGIFDAREPLNSQLLLAGAPGATQGERLHLGDLLLGSLNNRPLLLGLRLLIFSACQTSILDLRKAQGEMRSLTAAALEAGVDAAMGALWSVDDKATYLLMIRFAQIWTPQMGNMPPAVALAQAQQWLRTVTNRELRQWRFDSVPDTTVEERAEAGSAAPERDPWREEQAQAAAHPTSDNLKAARTSTVRGVGERLDTNVSELDADGVTDAVADSDNIAMHATREQRYDAREAQYMVQRHAARSDDDARAYADSYFWAGFQITGW